MVIESLENLQNRSYRLNVFHARKRDSRRHLAVSVILLIFESSKYNSPDYHELILLSLYHFLLGRNKK